ncbi:DUF2189 domain-containing protein [Roseovarius sp. SYSU LYC5161]|uniref:DUF2189 domain-containing protein n=1 Tax=Roseovarius halophilus (ex Wu et al. 2025) TaxID=3376060 RepID=UPI00399A40BF
MVKTIGNPLSWAAGAVIGSGRTAGELAASLGGEVTHPPETRPLTRSDIRIALRKGLDDFTARRSDVMFLVAIYPVIGICLAVAAFDMALLPLLFPLAAGFALLGPVAAIGLYEMSRQREAGAKSGWGAAFSVLRTHNIGPVLGLGLYLLALFVAWMFAAHLIYTITLGPQPPASAGAFLQDVFMTGAGWSMMILGVGVGFVFACVVLVISLISFPMLIDRQVGLPVAVMTSVQVARQSPVTVAGWGLIVAVAMTLGSLPLFLGLIVVLPVLGHATWHLYRGAVPREN